MSPINIHDVTLDGDSPGYMRLRWCMMYITETNSWQEMPQMCEARCHHTMVNYKGSLYVGGGCYGADPNKQSTFETFNSKINEWEPIRPGKGTERGGTTTTTTTTTSSSSSPGSILGMVGECGFISSTCSVNGKYIYPALL
jgi:hypothetical protein